MRAVYSKISLVAVMFASFVFACSSATARQSSQAGQRHATTPVSNIVACKALEVHTSSQPGVAVVLFHQRDKKGQARFASLLNQADGSTVEIRVSRGDRETVSVARLRMCFGRGLLLFSPNAIKLRDKDEFTVRFAAKTVQQ